MNSWLNSSVSPFGVPVFLCRCVRQLRAWSQDCCWIVYMWEDIRNLDSDEQEIRSQVKHCLLKGPNWKLVCRVRTLSRSRSPSLYLGSKYGSTLVFSAPTSWTCDKIIAPCLKGLERPFKSIWIWKLWHGFLLIWTWLWGFITCLISSFV